uniref:Uncharacterized protein n=1 Tax=Tanacetum cinerariifolium TaxID=118510 RepID=A0A6L2KN45_TANCI|nr:hypothetical protein [Tanacetum cinerariifolium]
MSSSVSNKVVNIAEQPRNSKPFLNSKNLACLTCKKCLYRANHDACILQYLSEVNSRASAQKTGAQSSKTTKRYKPVEKKINAKKHERRISKGHRFFPNKTFVVYMKTTPSRFGLTWKPTGRIFTSVGLRWIPTGKTVGTCLNINDSVIPLGKKTCTPNIVICANSSSLSAAILLVWKRALRCLVKRTSKYGESNASALEDLTLTVENPIKEVLIMNLPDHGYNIYTVKRSSQNRRISQ